MIKNLIVIPVRLESTRLPNKALLEVNGKSILQHTYEQCLKSKEADEVYIVTCNDEIIDIADTFDAGYICNYDTDSRCGTERIVYYLRGHHVNDHRFIEKVVSVQVDYPEINPLLIDRVFDSIKAPYSIVSALYFNKHPKKDDVCVNFRTVTNLCAGFNRIGDYANTHIGIYGFSNKIIHTLQLLYENDKSTGYDLEQNLWLEYGLTIKGLITDPTISINNQEDLDEFRKLSKVPAR